MDSTLPAGVSHASCHGNTFLASPLFFSPAGITSIKDTDIPAGYHRGHHGNHSAKFKDAGSLAGSPKRELPEVPQTHCGATGATALTMPMTSPEAEGKTERIYERSHPGSASTGSSSGYCSRPGGPVYFELEQQQQQQQQQQEQLVRSQNSYSA